MAIRGSEINRIIRRNGQGNDVAAGQTEGLPDWPLGGAGRGERGQGDDQNGREQCGDRAQK